MFPSSYGPAFYIDIVLKDLNANTIKQLWTMCATPLSQKAGTQDHILAQRLVENEKKTPSAIGEGAAIAHLHIAGLNEPVTAFMRLSSPLDMNAPDQIPVDLVSVLLTPEREGTAYLRTLARLSRILHDKSIVQKIRDAETTDQIRLLLEQGSAMRIAA